MIFCGSSADLLRTGCSRPIFKFAQSTSLFVLCFNPAFRRAAPPQTYCTGTGPPFPRSLSHLPSLSPPRLLPSVYRALLPPTRRALSREPAQRPRGLRWLAPTCGIAPAATGPHLPARDHAPLRCPPSAAPPPRTPAAARRAAGTPPVFAAFGPRRNWALGNAPATVRHLVWSCALHGTGLC